MNPEPSAPFPGASLKPEDTGATTSINKTYDDYVAKQVNDRAADPAKVNEEVRNYRYFLEDQLTQTINRKGLTRETKSGPWGSYSVPSFDEWRTSIGDETATQADYQWAVNQGQVGGFEPDPEVQQLQSQLDRAEMLESRVSERIKSDFYEGGGGAGDAFASINKLNARQNKAWEDFLTRVTDVENLVNKEQDFDIDAQKANFDLAEARQKGLVGPGFGTVFSGRPGNPETPPNTYRRYSADVADLFNYQTDTGLDLGGYVPRFEQGTTGAPAPAMLNIDPKLLAMVGKPSVMFPRDPATPVGITPGSEA